MAENDFVVNFGTDDFQVIFGEQGPQGPAAAATLFDINDTYEIGNIVYDAGGNLFSSKVNDNTGNALSDTDFWVALGIASGAVTQLNDLTDVVLDTPLLNQGLIYNGTDWVNKAIPNNTPVNPSQAKIQVTLNPAEVELNTGNVSVNAGIQLNTGFSFVSANFEIKDQNNHDLPFTGSGGNRNVTVDTTIRGHVSFVVTVFYTRNSDGTAGTETVTRELPIEEKYYSLLSNTEPTTVSQMSDLGVWQSPKELTQETTGSAASLLYVALPTDRAPYEFTSGLAIFSATSMGTISNDYTLFTIDDFDNSIDNRTFIVDIAEA